LLTCVALTDTVVSSFPQRQATGENDPDRDDMTDVFQSILMKSSQVKDKHGLARLILNECSSACFDMSGFLKEEFRIFDMFENSIGAVANSETAWWEGFIKMLETSSGDLSDITAESTLLREIKDILDELNMISLVFEEQNKIWSKISENQKFGIELARRDREQVSLCHSKVKSMQKRARMTYESLKDLMDLWQKYATLLQTLESAKQGNVIMVFTIVTILFVGIVLLYWLQFEC